MAPRLSRLPLAQSRCCALVGSRGRRTSWPRLSRPAASSVTCGATPPTAMVCRDSHVKSAILRGIPPSTARLDTRNKFRAFPIPYVSICQHMSAYVSICQHTRLNTRNKLRPLPMYMRLFSRPKVRYVSTISAGAAYLSAASAHPRQRRSA